MDKGYSVIIPVYNEAGSIAGTVKELIGSLDALKEPYEIIVVDDGSQEDIEGICGGLKVRFLRHPQNMGYGKAIQTGISASAYGLLAIIDADGTYAPQDLVRLLEYAQDYDMVVGVRENIRLRDSFFKFVSRKVYLRLVSYVTGVRVPDANSGLRVFKKEAVKSFYYRLCRGFSFTTTLTLAMLCQGFFVKFVPIGYKKREGRSKIRVFKDTLGTAQILVQEIMYYNPIKAILPFSMLFFALFLVNLYVYLSTSMSLYYLVSGIMLFASVLVFVLGLIADVFSHFLRRDA